ncbi:hypothetical protein P8605_20605 [Streptomyces sp. T-3]|nr:hypothetical protein [Streptomyces sp. T-3]
MRRTILATLTVATALCGLPGAQAATISPATSQRAATVQAGPEEHCGDIRTLSGGGNSANVKLCAKVDETGQTMNIATGSNCWNTLHTWPHCDVTGSWKMSRNGRQIAEGAINRPVPYVGPGTYEVVAEVSAHAHDSDVADAFSGTRLKGTLTSTFTLASERKDPPFTVEATPEHRNAQGETPFTFTVTHNGETETQADLMVRGHGISSTTPGCRTSKRNERARTVITCGIDKGATKAVQVTATKVGPRKCPVSWEVSWVSGTKTFGIDGKIPCA